MKTVVRRIARLEDHLRFADCKDPSIVVIRRLDRKLSLDSATSIQILRESGFLPSHAAGVVNFCEVPDGLNAEATKRFLREHGAEMCPGGGGLASGTPSVKSRYRSLTCWRPVRAARLRDIELGPDGGVVGRSFGG
jgi:hypothetical protein